jgi:predicted RNase H-like HicB family nuclease
MSKEYSVIIERDTDGFYIASVPELSGCHTQAKSIDELMERIKEVISLALEDDDDVTEPSQFVGVQRVVI